MGPKNKGKGKKTGAATIADKIGDALLEKSDVANTQETDITTQ